MVEYFEVDELQTIFRMVSVRNIQTSLTRNVLLIQYLGWPDFGVPSSSYAIRCLIQVLENCTQVESLGNGPPVLHCSAGVGRTGFLIFA